MAIKMVREPSETPNIRNIDDIIGLRYAYGNQDGYVIGKGNEISHSINGSTFTINSGRIVLQGVESDIDANGVSISVDNVAEMRYFTVYYKVNLATNTASIESTYDTVSFPNISTSDDLTKTTNGVANLVLYHFTAQNGVIQNIEKVVSKIEYVGTAFSGYDIKKGTIEERLTNLGFKQGSFIITNLSFVKPAEAGTALMTINKNSITRQGNYCIGNYSVSLDTIKNPNYEGLGYSFDLNYEIQVPAEFRPLKTIRLPLVLQEEASDFLKGYYVLEIRTDGTCSFLISENGASGLQGAGRNPQVYLQMINAGWEAAPLK